MSGIKTLFLTLRWPVIALSNPKVASNFYPKVAVKIDVSKCSTSSNSLFLGDIPLAQMHSNLSDGTLIQMMEL